MISDTTDCGARTMCSQYLSMVCFAPLGTRMVHLPPCSQVGSSHFGSIPALNRWKSVPAGSQLGGLMLLYKLRSDTVAALGT